MPRKKRCRPRDSDDDAGSVSRKRRHTESQGEIVSIPDSENEVGLLTAGAVFSVSDSSRMHLAQ